MGSGWLTSAAITALVVASIGFYWQRQLEHAFLLRKEKRDLFRELSRKMSIARNHVLDANYLSSREYRDLNDLLYELDILGCRDIFQRASVYRQALHNFHERIDVDDPSFEERYLSFIANVARLHAIVVKAISEDLRYTPTFFWQKRRYREVLNNLDNHQRELGFQGSANDPPE